LTELRLLESGLLELPLLLPLWTLPRPRCIRKVSLCSSNLHKNKNRVELLRRRSIICQRHIIKLHVKRLLLLWERRNLMTEAKWDDWVKSRVRKNIIKCREIYLLCYFIKQKSWEGNSLYLVQVLLNILLITGMAINLKKITNDEI